MENRNQSSRGAVELYGSFQIAQTELALPVAALQEVVNYPASITPVPLAPAHLLGLFNLRGTLIPIVDLRPLLKMPADSTADHAGTARKVAIVELGEYRVGLLFDATGEILRVPAAHIVTFDHSDGHPPVIAGALKLDDGERIVQVLSAAALLGLPEVPHLHHLESQSRRRVKQAQRHPTVSFRVMGANLALPMEAIQEIIRVPVLHPSPLTDPVCIGLLNLRGITIPVIDFARVIGLSQEDVDHHRHVDATLTVTTEGDDRRVVILKQHDVRFGFMVDEVSSIVGYRDDELLPMPAYARRHVSLFTGCITIEGRDSIILLSPDVLFAHPQLASLAEGHHDLFRGRVSADKSAERARGPRETYVTFRLNHLLGVRIKQLREVIDYSPDIVRAPGSPAIVRGVLHLRRELVTVVDLRAMLGMAAYDSIETTKVLIVEHEGDKYGLVVDSVDDIVTIDGKDRLKVPSIVKNQAAGALKHCMNEVVERPGHGTLMLVDLDALCSQVAVEAAL